MSIFQIIKSSKRNLIVFLVSYCLILSLITYGIYSITKVKKKPLIDNVNNPIDEEKEEEKKEEGNKQPQEEERRSKNGRTRKYNNPDNEKKDENKNNGQSIIKSTSFFNDKSLILLIEVIILWVLLGYLTINYRDIKDRYSEGFMVVIIYLMLHAIINYFVAIFFSIQEKIQEKGKVQPSDIWRQYKDYWKIHFNNLHGCLIFFLPLIVMPIIIIQIAIHRQQKKGDVVDNHVNDIH
ncbi:MAG: hypothetical protein J6Y70_00100 [Bacilli bacterium]|nr:hypothetical protein [Bacilli bacterium]